MLLLLMTVCALAADITGTWQATTEGPDCDNIPLTVASDQIKVVHKWTVSGDEMTAKRSQP